MGTWPDVQAAESIQEKAALLDAEVMRLTGKLQLIASARRIVDTFFPLVDPGLPTEKILTTWSVQDKLTIDTPAMRMAKWMARELLDWLATVSGNIADWKVVTDNLLITHLQSYPSRAVRKAANTCGYVGEAMCTKCVVLDRARERGWKVVLDDIKALSVK